MLHVGSWARFCALTIISLTIIACGKNPYNADSVPASSGRMVVETTEFPAVVMVILPGGAGICTGTFVSERAVLTAAHCTLTSGVYQVVTDWGTFATSTKIKLGAGVVEDPNDISLLVFSSNVADRSAGQVYDLATSVSTGEKAYLVGFGCTNITTKEGAGVKRMGTNVINTINDYVNFVTPNTNGAYGILGNDNVAGSCFGDSGGPALKYENGSYVVAGVTHAGGTWGSNIVSEYVNVSSNAANRSFINTVNDSYHLNMAGF